MQTQYVYTVSSVHGLVQQAIISIKSLKQFVDTDQIVVFVTPPIEDNDIQSLQSLGINVQEMNHYYNPMRKVRGASPRHFADKLHLCSVNADSVIFLDADTLILDDPSQLLTESDLRARPGNLSYSDSTWHNICTRQTNEYLSWMPNAGVLVFNNGAHHQIEDAWRTALSLQSDAGKEWTEQHALAVAAGELSTEKMTKREHVMLWADEYPSDGIIYHFGDRWCDSNNDEYSLITRLVNRLVP